MKQKFKNKYRLSSPRLRGYNYGQNGAYFVTICTKNHSHFFGEIVNGKMQLSAIGAIASHCWQHISGHFSFAELGEWVVMPNHVHGVIFIEKTGIPRCGDAINGDAINGDAINWRRNKWGRNKWGRNKWGRNKWGRNKWGRNKWGRNKLETQ